LSEEGLVVVVATIDYQHGDILAGPDILSRGFVYMRESGELISQAQRRVFRAIRGTFKGDTPPSEGAIRDAITDTLQDFLFTKTERHPMILPMLVNAK
jgi:ribonuclease J